MYNLLKTQNSEFILSLLLKRMLKNRGVTCYSKLIYSNSFDSRETLVALTLIILLEKESVSETVREWDTYRNTTQRHAKFGIGRTIPICLTDVRTKFTFSFVNFREEMVEISGMFAQHILTV